MPVDGMDGLERHTASLGRELLVGSFGSVVGEE